MYMKLVITCALALLLVTPSLAAFGFGSMYNPWMMRRRMVDLFDDPFFRDPFAAFEVLGFPQEEEGAPASQRRAEAVCSADDALCRKQEGGAATGEQGNVPVTSLGGEDEQEQQHADQASGLAKAENLWGAMLRMPALDIDSTDTSYLVSVDVPGVPKNEIELKIVHNDDGSNTLQISGERKEDKEEGSKEKGDYRRSHKYGKFSRSVRLPANIKLDEISASHENGVLKVVVPKLEAKPKMTSIKID